ncbi:hypothetical protein BDZ97DRAFT_1642618, partial [Flammula alnicola]
AKADIVAFSGNECDGDEGSNVACDNTCIGFPSRHSFLVIAPGDHCVVFFEDSSCSNDVGSVVSPGGAVQCTNVNTGTPVGSISCSPNSVC